jgi:hypothetical protein
VNDSDAARARPIIPAAHHKKKVVQKEEEKVQEDYE